MKYVTIVLAVFAFIYALDTISAIAAEFEEHGQDILSGNTEPEPVYHSMIATAYCLTGSTATGTTPRAGIAASKRSGSERPRKSIRTKMAMLVNS